jgi:hypothetical protein
MKGTAMQDVRMKVPGTCALCGTPWDRKTPLPSCNHTKEEWEAHFTAREQAGDPINIARRTFIVDEGELQRAREARATPRREKE